jgi:N-acetylglucosaminyldiphosphoundecaprenol N-acetyl-beta-D-mannosaminyltransferase
MELKLTNLEIFSGKLEELVNTKILITTINAHSFNVAKENNEFAKVLTNSGVLLPDGISIVWALKFLSGKRLHKIAGEDLFFYEMKRMNMIGGKCFFLGSNDLTLKQILERAKLEYPNVKIDSFSPPYKEAFNKEDTDNMLEKVNTFEPDVLFIGLTAPKQELWASLNYERICSIHICCIGAVFGFYGGTAKRAPKWMVSSGLEWLFRLISEPKRLWKRYLIGNFKFIFAVFNEKMTISRVNE